MANTKTKQAKPKTGLARCMELASNKKGLVFLSAVLSSLAAIASFVPYIAVYFIIRSIIRGCHRLRMDGIGRDSRQYPAVFSGYFQFPHGGVWNAV